MQKEILMLSLKNVSLESVKHCNTNSAGLYGRVSFHLFSTLYFYSNCVSGNWDKLSLHVCQYLWRRLCFALICNLREVWTKF